MENLAFLLQWHFLLGVVVGWFVGPYLTKLVSKFKK